MVEAFRSLGVEAVPGPGNPFDPEVHEAIMREENDDMPDGTVLKEFRRGFKLGSQLLRAAMVQVRDCATGSAPARVAMLSCNAKRMYSHGHPTGCNAMLSDLKKLRCLCLQLLLSRPVPTFWMLR